MRLLLILLALLLCSAVILGLRSAPKQLPPELVLLLRAGQEESVAIPPADSGAMVGGRHLLTWAAGEWLVRNLQQVEELGWPERAADSVVRKVLAATGSGNQAACEEALREAVAADRLGAAAIILSEGRACLTEEAITSASALATQRGVLGMQAIFQLAAGSTRSVR